ncbi:MAG: amidohydrolase [Clostridia bacterium]|nr:amidohydrolase [Clostridia bacterium]
MPKEKEDHMRIIDTHAHLVQCIAGFGEEGELRAIGDGSGRARYATGSVVQMVPECFHADQVLADDLIRDMDANGIEKAVLLQGNYYGFQNLYTWDAMTRYPQRFAGAAMYDPYASGKERVRDHLFRELGFTAVKFELSIGSGIMGMHPELRLNDPVMVEAIDYAANAGQVIILDIGKYGSPSWQVEAAEMLVRRHPETKFVFCHLLAPNGREADEPGWRDAMSRLALPNVWMDISSLSHNVRPDVPPYEKTRRYLAQARDILGADHLLFGTDYPSVLKEMSYKDCVDIIRDADCFNEKEKAQILFENADSVFFGA